jgi:hypothetical protein
MSGVSKSTLRLGDIAAALDVDIVAFCEPCGAPLGPYVAGLRYPQRDVVIISERGGITRSPEIGTFKRDVAAQLMESTLGVRGPRTQPGLYESASEDGSICGSGAAAERTANVASRISVSFH